VEPQVNFEGTEIPVAMKKPKAAFDTAGGDKRVYGFAYRDSQFAKGPEIPGGLNSSFCTRNIDNFERGEDIPGSLEVAIFVKTLENFREDQITDGDGF
jgi:hypothetical protein